MINLDNILNTPIIQDPWPHQLIDNILTDDAYAKIIEGAEILGVNAKAEPRDPNGLWMFKARELGVGQEVIDLVMKINKQLLLEHDKVLARYPKAMRSNIGYFSIPRFNFIGPNVTGTIHDEGDSKTMAMVIYLFPEKTFGTRLYTDEDYSTFVKEVEWKTNRAFLMCSDPGVTWHSFHSDDQPRMTINFYYEKMEKMGYINELGIEKMEWFYDEFAKDNICINLE